MKPYDPRVIENLNEVLTAELTGINQYFLHAEMCQNWGYERLYKQMRGHSIGEMKHAEEIIERVLFLDGVPNMQRLGKVNIGETVPEMLKLDLELEMEALTRLGVGVKLAREVGDHATAEMLEHMVESEEEHVDWIEAQLTQIEQIGEPNYLAAQIRHES